MLFCTEHFEFFCSYRWVKLYLPIEHCGNGLSLVRYRTMPVWSALLPAVKELHLVLGLITLMVGVVLTTLSHQWTLCQAQTLWKGFSSGLLWTYGM